MMYTFVVFVICAVLSAVNIAGARSCRGFVGFSVALHENKALTAGQKIVYKTIHTNAGNHYNPETGVFTAPKTAYYQFHFNAITSIDGSGFWLQLVQNEDVRATIYASSPTTLAMAGNSALLHLKAGDIVYVKAYHATSNIFGDRIQHHTTFTGHLAGY